MAGTEYRKMRMEEEEEMPIMLEYAVNALARLNYQAQGCIVPTGYNFSKAVHPAEVAAWNAALVAHAFILKDDYYLQFQK